MTIEDQELPVKVCINDTKLQLKKISLNNTGYGSWDQGEIRLIGKPDDWKSKKEIKETENELHLKWARNRLKEITKEIDG